MPPCSACGLNEPGTRFCRRCGASLRLDAARIGSAGNRNSFELALAERRRVRIITAACTGALVVMLGAGAWWYSSGSTSQATDEFQSTEPTDLASVDLQAPGPEGVGGDPLAQVPPEPQAVSLPPAPSYAEVSSPPQKTPEPDVPSSPPPAPPPARSRLQGVQTVVDEGQPGAHDSGRANRTGGSARALGSSAGVSNRPSVCGPAPGEVELEDGAGRGSLRGRDDLGRSVVGRRSCAPVRLDCARSSCVRGAWHSNQSHRAIVCDVRSDHGRRSLVSDSGQCR